MVIGQAPSRTDAQTGRPFSGPGGARLRAWLQQAGIEENEVYYSALTKCYPGAGSNGKGDRPPTREERAHCRPFLVDEVALVSPELILLVGALAIREFLGAGALASFIGKAYPIGASRRLVALFGGKTRAQWAVPLPHCSGASLWLNDPDHQTLLNRALEQIRTILAHGSPLP